jgi:hypothetical protein
VIEALSVVVAGVALIASVMQQKRSNALQQRLADVEDRRLAEREDDRRRESALGISAWWSDIPELAGSDTAWGVIVANARHFPVRDVTIALTNRGQTTAPLVLTVLPPGEWLFPYNQGTDKWQPVRGASDAVPVMRSKQDRVDSLEFTDAAGDTWRREGAELVHVSGAVLHAELGSTS